MKISVLVPTYNSEKHIQECIESICFQDTNENYKLELFVIDNSSSDRTCEIIEEIKKKNEFIFIKNVPNIYKNSCQEAIEIFFKKMTGDWFTIVHSDDYLNKDYFNICFKIIEKMKLKKNYVFQTIMNSFFDNSGKTNGYIYHEYKNLEEFKRLFLKKCPVNAPAVFYSREIIDKIKFDDGTLNGAGDYKIWGDFASEGIFISSVPFYVGYNYRLHPSQCTWQILSNKEENEKNLDGIKEYYRKKWGVNE